MLLEENLSRGEEKGGKKQSKKQIQKQLLQAQNVFSAVRAESQHPTS